MRTFGLLVLAAGLAGAAPPSQVDVEEHTVYSGQYLDLDTGTVLSKPEAGELEADFQFAPNKGERAIVPLNGAAFSPGALLTLDEFPEELDLSAANVAPVDLTAHSSLTGRTSAGNAFKATVWLSWVGGTEGRVRGGNGIPWIFVEVAIQKNGSALFPAPVSDLTATFSNGAAEVRWRPLPDERVRVSTPFFTHESAGGRCVVPDLPPGGVITIRVARLTSDGGEGEPRTTTLNAAPGGVARFSLDLTRRAQQEFRVNLREGKPDEAHPDWIFSFEASWTPPGGGIRRIGVGPEALKSVSELPRWGYAPRVDRYEDNAVYAVRLRDGRYALVHVLPATEWQRTFAAEIVFLRGGGLVRPSGPDGLQGSYKQGTVSLSWAGAPGAAGYTLYTRNETGFVPLRDVEGATVDLPDQPSHAFLTFGVATRSRDGAVSDVSEIEISSFPSYLLVGRFDLDYNGREFFDFSTLKSGTTQADLRSIGGVVMFSQVGIGPGSDNGFGKFSRRDLDDLRAKLKPGQVQVHGRNAQNEFSIATREGGYAHVRLLGIRQPRVHFQYVYMRPRALPGIPEIVAALKTVAGDPSPELQQRAAALVARFADDDSAVRDRSQEELVEIGPSITAFLETTLKESTDAETQARIEKALMTLWQKHVPED